MNKYPAKPMMDEMARHGRYGDSMLVHMNPIEVAGLASLSPTGKLTTNPVTGQPEAFVPLLFGGLGSLLKLSPLMSGVLTGVGTAAVTGDVKRGLISGLTAGFAGAAGDAVELGELGASADAVTTSADVGANVASAAQDTGMGLVTDVGTSVAQDPGMLDSIRSSIPDFMKDQPEILDTVGDKLGFTGSATAAAIGQGAIEEDKMLERARRQNDALLAEAEADQARSRALIEQGAIAAGAPRGISPERDVMAPSLTPPPPAASMGAGQMASLGLFSDRPRMTGSMSAQGSIAEILEEDKARGAPINAQEAIRRLYGMNIGGPVPHFYNPFTMGQGNPGYQGVDPFTVQERLAPGRKFGAVAPPRDYRTGFEPEFSYFQDLERDEDGNPTKAPVVPDRSYRPTRQGVMSLGSYFDPLMQSPQFGAGANEYRRSMQALDFGPTDPEIVMGLASEGSILSPMQQNVLEEVYRAPAPAPTPVPGPEEDSVAAGREQQLIDAGVNPDIAKLIANNQYNYNYLGGKGGNLAGMTQPQLAAAADALNAAGTVQQNQGNAGYQATAQAASSLGDDLTDLSLESLKERFPDLPEESIIALQNLSTFRGTMMSGGGDAPLRDRFYNLDTNDPRGEGFELDADDNPVANRKGMFQGLSLLGVDQETIDNATRRTAEPPKGLLDIIEKAIYEAKKRGLIDERTMPGIRLSEDDLEELEKSRAFTKASEMKAGGAPMPEVGPPMPSVGPPPDVPIRASAIGSQADMRNGMIAGGGLASLPTEAVGNMQPSQADIMELAQSVLGKVSQDQQQAINDKFRRRYGDLAFREFRTKILRTVVPNAQTEGLIRGGGGGMDDEIYGMINDNQPVALSSGEYVIPADGVADIGDGSTEAGARRIAEAVEEKRLERHGTRKQPPETKKDTPLF